MAETLVRFVDLAASAKQHLPVCVTTRNGQVLNEPEEMFPDWLAISAVEESSLETFVLYWLSLSGEIIDFAQRNTLEEVLAEVSNAVRRSDWRECKVSLSDASEPQIPRALID